MVAGPVLELAGQYTATADPTPSSPACMTHICSPFASFVITHSKLLQCKHRPPSPFHHRCRHHLYHHYFHHCHHQIHFPHVCYQTATAAGWHFKQDETMHHSQHSCDCVVSLNLSLNLCGVPQIVWCPSICPSICVVSLNLSLNL